LSDLAGRIILAFMSAQLSQEGGIWRVKIVWPNGAVRYFGKFTSEREAIDWINAHPRLTKSYRRILVTGGIRRQQFELAI